MIQPFHFIAKVKFKQNNQVKIRPILIITIDGTDSFSGYRITTKFKHKSNYYQHYYYQIRRINIAGLDKPSYIDTTSYEVLRKDQLVNQRPIGKLSDTDLDALLEFLKTRNKYW